MTMEDKMLKEKERNNIGWTSAADFQTSDHRGAECTHSHHH